MLNKKAIEEFLCDCEFNYSHINNISINKRTDNEWNDLNEFPYEIMDGKNQIEVINEGLFQKLTTNNK